MTFSSMIDQLFTDPVLSKPATWIPSGLTDGFPVRVIAKLPDTVVGFAEAQIHASTTLFDVRRIDVPEPAVGDLLICENITYIVQSEPKSDRERLVWTLDVRPQ